MLPNCPLECLNLDNAPYVLFKNWTYPKSFTPGDSDTLSIPLRIIDLYFSMNTIIVFSRPEKSTLKGF